MQENQLRYVKKYFGSTIAIPGMIMLAETFYKIFKPQYFVNLIAQSAFANAMDYPGLQQVMLLRFVEPSFKSTQLYIEYLTRRHSFKILHQFLNM